MAQPNVEQDPTMEEILQSIKRIIAEDSVEEDDISDDEEVESEAPALDAGVSLEAIAPPPSPAPSIKKQVAAPVEEVIPLPVQEVPVADDFGEEESSPFVEELLKAQQAPVAAPAPVAAAPVVKEDVAPKKVEPKPVVSKSEVLELTEMVRDDGSVVSIAADVGNKDLLKDIDSLARAGADEAAPAAPKRAQPKAAPVAEVVLETPPPPPEPEVVPEVAVEEAVHVEAMDDAIEESIAEAEEELDSTESVMGDAEQNSDDKETYSESLLSEATRKAASMAFAELISHTEVKPDVLGTMVTRQGNTIEDLLMETMKPLLKQWLDQHLPRTVERIVQEEISKLLPR